MRKFDLARVAGLLLAVSSAACAATPPNTDPEAAGIVTEDLQRFWQAWDAAAGLEDPAARAEVFDTHYLARGTPGLEAFTRLRIGDAGKLVDAIDAHPAYYAALRGPMTVIEAQKPEIRATFHRMAALYPEAVFPDVYFLIGRMNSGGTIDRAGLLVGVEMFGRADGVPLHELGDWHQAVVGELDAIPALVAHEWVHFQQRYDIDGQPTLLEQSLGEGVADFVAELGSGQPMNAHVHAWAEPRAAELWAEFEQVMDGTDYAGWLYDGANADGRPADLGYWIGYRIAKAHYDAAPDKRTAIREMLNIRDAKAYLEASGLRETLAGG